jgi:hypothetical protein
VKQGFKDYCKAIQSFYILFYLFIFMVFEVEPRASSPTKQELYHWATLQPNSSGFLYLFFQWFKFPLPYLIQAAFKSYLALLEHFTTFKFVLFYLLGFVFVFVFWDRVSHVAQTGLELLFLLPRLPSAGITGIYHHFLLKFIFIETTNIFLFMFIFPHFHELLVRVTRTTSKNIWEEMNNS